MPDYLGEFETLVLLALARLGDDAYGVTIRETLRERAGRRASFGAIYSTLRRLEAKGLVRSFRGDPEPVRGGRAKKHVVLTARGQAALRQTHTAFSRMAAGVAGLRR
jgi:DNA-binding PadR family transcriptional regulator